MKTKSTSISYHNKHIKQHSTYQNTKKVNNDYKLNHETVNQDLSSILQGEHS